ncbi:WD40 repeat domain-containing protein [Variovorax sp. DXTD-1]|uniref:WD40 repeat domain-containing protein n=1 Tax=Variovorax sp. DXTD-1 TaxID=2495592 RepID=UPI000F88F845|nr:WD40 repeat domain-containing protein [Variovorax sp. DXTD-1]RST47373.1 WD40 repeat domain-containing protein [Variovorax sp. DXTD-1]
MTIKTFFAGMAALALLLVNGCSARATPVMEETGVLELPYAVQSLAWHPDGRLLAVGYFMRDVVEVWDVHTKKPVFSVPSTRRPVNLSGQEVLFSPDGKYLVVQDFLDTKDGAPKFPRRYEDPEELTAQQDKDRYILARVWDIEQHKEIAQLKGPGSVVYGGAQDGFCWIAGGANQLAVHRKAIIQVHDMPSARLAFELNASHPFADKPDQRRGYWKMACHPTRPEVALEGAQLFKEAPQFGFPANSGATPIVVADLDRKAIKKVLFSPTPLNGVAYSADGSKLVSFGMSPSRVWDANRDFAALGEIENPPEWLWLNQRGMKVDMLHPPPNIPRGNAGELVFVAETDLMFGLSGDLYLWSLSEKRAIEHLPGFPDIFRISVHQPSLTFGVAEGRRVHFYQLNRSALSTSTK